MCDNRAHETSRGHTVGAPSMNAPATPGEARFREWAAMPDSKSRSWRRLLD
ncbi:MAG: hypothetical protein FD127_3398, partial [Acidimicrobiaceae bacterium]